MRSLIIYFLCFFISFSAFSQDLTGEWKGYYTYDEILKIPEKVSIGLSIKRNSDKSYTIFSYTKFHKNGKDTIEMCKVLYKKIGKQTIQLEERKYKDDEIDNSVFQKMFLRFRERDGVKELYGTWEDAGGGGPMRGDIIFTKSK